MRVLILIGVLSLTAGCYNYQPLATPSPAVGSYISVTLNDAGSEQLTRYLGPNIFVVRGRFLGNSDEGAGGGLVVSASSVEAKRGDEFSWRGETVRLPADAIASLDVRRLSKGRSLLLAGVGAGGVVATTLAFSLLGGGTQPGPGGGRPSKQ
jgi:hypothetical protein